MNSSEANPLKVPPIVLGSGPLEENLQDQGVHISIDQGNWVNFTDPRVKVDLTLGYSEAGVLLYYQVQEPEIRALVDQDQGPVYQDSCVEWFVTPPGPETLTGQEPDYLNFEWNSKGFLLHYRGPDRRRRTPAAPQVLAKVLRKSKVASHRSIDQSGDQSAYPKQWSLLAQVPFEVLGVTDPKAGLWRANFYKCGDLLARPHYYSWQKMDTPEPDFHRPEFFGFLEFL
ncbi:MAG: hypothetical protein GW949_09070 [Spirochaetales bacterium]|nr:hypothetical protein [Spirochaetales bacterium]